MAISLQTLVIPVGAIATFAGVYAIAPVGHGKAAPDAQTQSAAAAAASSPAPAARPAFNPLAPAADGRVECYEPDTKRKTCEVIASYTPLGGNRYQARAVMLVSPRGPIVMELSSPVTVEAGEVCGKTRRKDYEAANFRVGGRTLSRREVARLWVASEETLAPNMNRNICTSYAKSSVGVIATDVMDNRWKVGERRVIWIKRGNGYRVAA